MSDSDTPHVSRRPTLPLVWIVPLLALAVGGWMVFREFSNRGPEITIEFPNGTGIEPRRTIVLYKGVTLGMVTGVSLKDDFGGVLVRARLNRTGEPIAREGSKFWVVSPEIGFNGVRGLETLFTGARINVEPGNGAPATSFKGLERPPPVEDTSAGRAFILQGERLGSITPGAPVFYREVKVGVVENSRLAADSSCVIIRIRIQKPYVDLVRTNTRFWNAGGVSFKVSLLGAELKSTSLESLFTGGIAFATPDSGRELAEIAPDGTVFKLYDELEKEWLTWSPRIHIKPPNESPEPPTHSGPLAPLVKP